MARRGLGRGLNALIPENVKSDESKDIVKIKISDLYPNNAQPRKNFDEDKLIGLCESIKKHGVLQPIVVKPDENGKYMIIAGERRYRASIMAEKEEIPAIIKDISFKEVMELALIENLQREDLNIIEEAIAYKNLIESYDYTQETLSNLVGKSRPYIANTMRLLNLSSEVIRYIELDKVSAGHGKILLRISDDNQQILVAKKIIEEDLSVRKTEELVKNLLKDKVEKKKKEKDIFIRDIEERLASTLGTKVSISTGKKKGKIEIEYYSEDDLNDIIEKLLNE